MDLFIFIPFVSIACGLILYLPMIFSTQPVKVSAVGMLFLRGNYAVHIFEKADFSSQNDHSWRTVAPVNLQLFVLLTQVFHTRISPGSWGSLGSSNYRNYIK